MAECSDKNMIDKDEYPQTAEIEARCVRMLGELWHAPHATESVGTSTTGSSEGCMLSGLALKRRWQQARRKAGGPMGTPNIVMGANVQVVWEKFANYWEVEPRYVPLEGDVFQDAERLAAAPIERLVHALELADRRFGFGHPHLTWSGRSAWRPASSSDATPAG